MSDKILFVDDDANILAGYKRALRLHFQLVTALGGEEGLMTLASEGPFSVVMADMRMPNMDGIQFLTKVKERSPDTVRMMLTGNTDLQTAMDAVNKGNIFRFLTKPCPPETLSQALSAGLEQYRLVTAEKELLEKTLAGSIRVLTEILSMVNPAAFSRSTRAVRYVRHIVAMLQLPNQWQFELAAMLSQIGCVTLPSETTDKMYAQGSLAGEEKRMFLSHPVVGGRLLANIPRLEPIARMIEGQQKPFKATLRPLPENLAQGDMTVVGAHILKVAIDFDQLVLRGVSQKAALQAMRERGDEYNPQVLTCLESIQVDMVGKAVATIKIKELVVGMVACEDVYARSGLLLLTKGQEVTLPVLERLQNFARVAGVKEPVLVQMP